jgi:hypothetical protein
VSRRSFLAPLAALVAILAIVLAACSSSASQAPALTDPKEILTKTATSLADVKTVEMTGSFNGSVKADQLGNIDLSTMTLSAAMDVPNKKAKVSLDAPTLMGTKLDGLLIDQSAYYKVAGPLAMMLNASADKWTKVPVPDASTSPAGDVTDPQAAVTQLNDALSKLPAPVKQADEKCGDQDCYHVTIHVSAADMKAMDPTSSVNGDVTVDVWTRKNDYRPAKIGVNVATVDMGTFGATFEFTYDGSVSIEAPPADQVVTPSFSLPNFALPSLPATQ